MDIGTPAHSFAILDVIVLLNSHHSDDLTSNLLFALLKNHLDRDEHDLFLRLQVVSKLNGLGMAKDHIMRLDACIKCDLNAIHRLFNQVGIQDESICSDIESLSPLIVSSMILSNTLSHHITPANMPHIIQSIVSLTTASHLTLLKHAVLQTKHTHYHDFSLPLLQKWSDLAWGEDDNNAWGDKEYAPCNLLFDELESTIKDANVEDEAELKSMEFVELWVRLYQLDK